MKIGDKIENKGIKELLENDWIVHKVKKFRRKIKYGWISQGEDIFGLFDCLAVKKKEVRFIQFSTRYLSMKSKEWRKRWAKFPYQREYWRWDKKKKKFMVRIYK